MKKSLSPMRKVLKAFTGSSFVGREVFPRLPRSVSMEFRLEFNERGKTCIAISSPEYPGIISEARTMEEAYEHALDAILTYFEVPRDCANAMKFKLVQEPTKKTSDGNNILFRRIEIKQMAHA
ncbi:hypothetical protein HY285_04280 [Candidatus Peregrinibacteria bacterium]|nr:hypothetical protein [Candidatus Peregrinibacteria bacterium]MBI3816731.1 hypothetical protein [Candidatus Peregrinibacteria bacterium]